MAAMVLGADACRARNRRKRIAPRGVRASGLTLRAATDAAHLSGQHADSQLMLSLQTG